MVLTAIQVAGNVAGLPAAYMNKMVLGYLGLRFLYGTHSRSHRATLTRSVLVRDHYLHAQEPPAFWHLGCLPA